MKVAQLCRTLCNSIDYTVHRILQARILEWVAIPFCRGSSQSRDWSQVSHIAGRFFTSWATWGSPQIYIFLLGHLHGLWKQLPKSGMPNLNYENPNFPLWTCFCFIFCIASTITHSVSYKNRKKKKKNFHCCLSLISSHLFRNVVPLFPKYYLVLSSFITYDKCSTSEYHLLLPWQSPVSSSYPKFFWNIVWYKCFYFNTQRKWFKNLLNIFNCG